MPQARKRFGQHWLQSEKALQQIIKAAEIVATDRVLEIGPGTGNLTRILLPLVQSLLAIEIDRDLCEHLAKKLGKKENFLLLQADFLSLDIEQQLQNLPLFQNPNKVVANIPYNITGPILEKLLGTIAEPALKPFESIVLLVQKEVADRLCANPGSKAFGALSVRVQYLATCDYIATVPARAFHPAPKVDSAIIRLRPQIFQPATNNPQLMDSLIKVGFSSKRKMLRNNLSALTDRDQVTHLLEQLNLNPQVRAEDLSPADWVALTNAWKLESSPAPTPLFN